MDLNPFKHLSFRLFFLTGLLLILFIASFAYYSYLQNNEKTLKDLSANFSASFKRLSDNLRIPLWNWDAIQAQELINVELQDKNISGIIVFEKTDFVWIASLRNSKGEIVTYSKELEATIQANAFEIKEMEYISNNIRMGSIRMYLNNQEILKKSQAEFFKSLLQTSLVALIALMISFVYFKKAIVDPIIQLKNTVIQFGHGDYSIRSNTKRSDEIGLLINGFNDMASRLQNNAENLENTIQARTAQLIDAEKFAFLGSLVSGVAHEINTPIGIGITAVSHELSEIKNIKEQFQKNELTKSALERFINNSEESALMIESNLVRASSFIQSFKMIAVDQSTEEARSFNLYEYIEEIVFTMRPKLKKTKHQVNIECDKELFVIGYPGGISQIITNLIMNSLIHGLLPEAEGHITIKAEIEQFENQTLLNIFYSDDGKGISKENLRLIFTPFFTTLKGSGGTGLGLFIIQRTTTSLGGTIKCTSELGKGVLFTIKIPVNLPKNGVSNERYK